MNKRVFLIVLDSMGIGGAPDADEFGDYGSDTLNSISHSDKFNIPNLCKLGLVNIDGVNVLPKEKSPTGAYARLVEVSKGKDTTIGHWEIAGVESKKPLPVFPDGFPKELIDEFEKRVGRKTIVNKPYSGTKVIDEYGEEHLETGSLIIYTSADSVFQIAANESIVPIDELYSYCEIAREMLVDDWAVGRVIARPFVGESRETFKRTPNRHDYSLLPPAPTVLDALKESGQDVIGVGKIYDIFAGQGITKKIATKSNNEGMQVAMRLAKEDFSGLVFINLVEFDMVYGHRNDVDGYANALTEFDEQLSMLLPMLREGDLLMITADHGCDPATPSTDHSRECVPLVISGANVCKNTNLGTRVSFSHIASTIAEYLGVEQRYGAKSLLKEFLND